MSGEAGVPARTLLLLDTHVLLWSASNGPRMGRHAGKAIEHASREGRLAVSAITPWEIALLVSKGRLKLGVDVMDWLRNALANPGLHVAPLEPDIAVASTRLPFDMHADPADRILVATARHLGATFVTTDKALLDLAKKGYFRAIDAAK